MQHRALAAATRSLRQQSRSRQAALTHRSSQARLASCHATGSPCCLGSTSSRALAESDGTCQGGGSQQPEALPHMQLGQSGGPPHLTK